MKISIIGFGNLGRAFTGGLINVVKFRPEDITVCARSAESLQAARDMYGVNTENEFSSAVEGADIVFFIVKQSAFTDIITKSKQPIDINIPLVSFMAGLSINSIRELTGTKTEIIRAMPNLAIEEGSGIIGHTPTQNKIISDIFSGLGYRFETDEEGIDKITAFAACGLGLASYILEAYSLAGKALGIDEKLCHEITKQTFISAANQADYMKTVAAVATKGGATERGLKYLSDMVLGEIIKSAVVKAYQRVINV